MSDHRTADATATPPPGESPRIPARARYYRQRDRSAGPQRSAQQPDLYLDHDIPRPPHGLQHHYTAPPQTYSYPPSPIPMFNPFHMPIRPHPLAPAAVLHDLGHGPTPLFGWESVIPIPGHGYGQPKYARRVKPDYRRFCFSVGKAEVPYAALPGGPLYGYPTYTSEQLVGGGRW